MFNKKRNSQINKAHEDFIAIINKINVSHWILGKNSVNDIIYQLHKDLKDGEE